MDDMISKKSWKEFKDSGFLWAVNQFLHIFGWSIVISIDKDSGEIIDVYPARVKYRGFSEDSQTKGYRNISKYMKENAEELLDEAMK